MDDTIAFFVALGMLSEHEGIEATRYLRSFPDAPFISFQERVERMQGALNGLTFQVNRQQKF